MRKRLGVILGLAIAVVLLAATAQAGTRAHTVTNVTLAGWSSGPGRGRTAQPGGREVQRRRIRRIHVDFSVINGDYATAMTARFAAHNPPDVFYVDSSVARTWAAAGSARSRSTATSSRASSTRARSSRACSSAFKSGNTVYGFPKDWSPLAMEINKGDARQSAAARRRPPGRSSNRSPRRWRTRTSSPAASPICLAADWARMLAFVYQDGGSLSSVTSPARRERGQLLRRPPEQGPRRDARQARRRLVR